MTPLTPSDFLVPYCSQPERPSDTGPAVIGQIVHTVVPEVLAPWQVFDVTRANQVQHTSAAGNVRQARAGVDFRPKPERLPVFGLRLGSSEEVLLTRAKMRPCVVLATAPAIDPATLPKAEQGIARPALGFSSFMVAPAYSVSTPTERRAMTPTIATRAECLVYPQLMFLPRSGGIIANDSVVRLDRAFWTTLPPPTELCKLALSPERLEVCMEQMDVLRGFTPTQDYLGLVHDLRGLLPPEYESPRP